MPGTSTLSAAVRATRDALRKAKDGGGPTLIEAVTYRLMMHTTADDPKRYRSDEEVALWQQRDPLPRFAAYLQQKGAASEAHLAEIETRVMEEIQAAVEAAEKRMQELDDPLAMFDHLYAAMPPHLEGQKSALAAELADDGKEVHDE